MTRYRYNQLGAFIADLERAGELKRIAREISWHLDISRLTDAASKSPNGGKALFFERVKGSPFPAATNLFGSPRRICMALGVKHLDQLGDRVRAIIQRRPPQSLRDMFGLLPTALNVARAFPVKSRKVTPPCQQVILRGNDIDLHQLPVLHCWPQDAGRFITLPLVITRSLSSGQQNMGMYRMQLFDGRTTGMHWHIHKDGANFYNEYRRAGRRMPVAVVIGADPAVIYAATAPLPRNVDELLLAGFIRHRPVAVTRCITNDLLVPAEAEFILEGYVDPFELRREGPFGDHTGYYSLADDYPVFHLTAITHRRQPVYCATLVGRPPMEDCYLAKATERLFLPLLQTAFPEISDYWLPWEGVFHNIVVVAIRKEYPLHAQKVISGLWGQGQMSFCKAIVVVDEEIDPQSGSEVLRQVLTHLDVTTDLVLSQGVLDVLDHSSPHANFGGKVGLDLTRRITGEPPRRASGPASRTTPLEASLCQARQALPAILNARECPAPDDTRNRILFLNVQRESGTAGRAIAATILDQRLLIDFNIIILYDAAINLAEHSLILWKLFNNLDPARDLCRQDGRLVADACIKTAADGHTRPWPDELSFDF